MTSDTTSQQKSQQRRRNKKDETQTRYHRRHNSVPQLRHQLQITRHDDDLTDAQVVVDVIQARQLVHRDKRWKAAIEFEDEGRPNEQSAIDMDAGIEAKLGMESGSRAGLQSAAEVKAVIGQTEKHELIRFPLYQFLCTEARVSYSLTIPSWLNGSSIPVILEEILQCVLSLFE